MRSAPLSPRDTDRTLLIVSGFLFFAILGLAVGLHPSHPDSAASPEQVRDQFAADAGRLQFEIYLASLSLIPAFAFLAAIYRAVRGPDGHGANVWAATVLVSGVVALAVNLATSVFHASLAMRAATLSPDAIQVLFDLGNVGLNYALIPIATLSATTGIAGYRSGAFGRGPLLVSVGAAAVQLVASAGTYESDGWLAPNGPVSVAAVVSIVVWAIVVWATLGFGRRTRARALVTGVPSPQPTSSG